MTPDATLVIPTYNEVENVAELLARLTAEVAPQLAVEVVFVDDSTDGTPAAITAAAAGCPFPVTVLHRDAPAGGLGGAVVEGLRAATAPWVVVMDADLQHPPEVVPLLVRAGDRDAAELVVASRYAAGGATAGLAGGYRLAVSGGSTRLSHLVLGRALRGISDPMSGFFAVRRSIVPTDSLRPLGYKILLELVVRCRPSTVAEVPYHFAERYAGTSKARLREGFRFLRHLFGLRFAAAGGADRPADRPVEVPEASRVSAA